MAKSGIETRQHRFSNRDDAQTYELFSTLTVLLCNKSSRHVKMRKRKKKNKNADYWIEYFPFEKYFRQKITNGVFGVLADEQ